MNPRRQMLLTGLGAIDLMLVLYSIAVALALTTGMPLTGLLERSLSLGEVLLLALYLLYCHVALATAGLYGSYRLASASRELRDVAFAAGLACAPVPLFGALLGYQRIGAAFAVTLWALSVMAVAVGRRLLRAVGGLVRHAGRNLRDVVVAGEGARRASGGRRPGRRAATSATASSRSSTPPAAATPPRRAPRRRWSAWRRCSIDSRSTRSSWPSRSSARSR